MQLVTKIVSVRRATSSSRLLRLALGEPFEYEAGQAAMIRPPGAELRIPYSMASAPEDTRANGTLEFLVKDDVAEKWGPLQPRFRRGMLLEVHGPFGNFVFPREPAERRFLFIAGGTGISPLRSMIRHALATGHAGAIDLLYSARAHDQFAFLSEFRAMARRGEITLALNVTRDIPVRWRGARGRVARQQLASMLTDVRTLCFVCGPEPMVADVAPMLGALGVPRERIRLEEW